VTSLKLERGTAGVKVPSQHLSGMVEDNDRNPVELISVGSDSNMGPLRYEKLCKIHHRCYQRESKSNYGDNTAVH